MEIETINKLYLELSQVATATTKREQQLIESLKSANSVLRSAKSIADRNGVSSDWVSFRAILQKELAAQHQLMYPKG